jgi:Ca-activated chloride channel family protein
MGGTDMKKQDKPIIEVYPLKEKALSEESSQMDFLIRITAPEIQIGKERPLLNLGLVLDRSGSMSGEKIENAKKAACYCVDQLMSTDRISVTIFDDRVDTIITTMLVENRSEIKGRINQIRSGGTTALHAAWVEGGRQVAECLNPGCLNRVVLVTDGLANVGETDPDTIVSQALGLNKKNISTSTIGIGNDFNEDLLIPMAKAAGGNSWFVEGPEDFQRIFETEMEGILRDVCTNVSLKIEPEKRVEILAVLNDFDSISHSKYSLPNLLSGDPLDIVVRTQLPGGQKGNRRVFNLKLEWNPQGNNKKHSEQNHAKINYATEDEVKIQEENIEVQKAVQLLEAAKTRRTAMEYLDKNEYKRASAILNEASESAQMMAKIHNDSDLHAESMALDNLSKNIKNKKGRAHTRKVMAYQSVNRQRGRREKQNVKDKRSS